MKNLFTILLCICVYTLFNTIAFAQSSTSIVLDASSLTPVNTDAVTGLAIDHIGRDRFNRECARIMLHINRMTPEEISQLEIVTKGGIIDVRNCVPNYNGTGLIIELTAKPETRFYLYHKKYGDSNEVTVSLEGNREYTMNAWNEPKLSIVVAFPESGAEVYLDEAFRGFVENNLLTVSDLTLGHHDLSFRYSAGDYSERIYISPSSIYFEIDPEKKGQDVLEISEPDENGDSGLGESEISVLGAESLSENGTANSYIVSTSGTYSFPAVKGNSSESVGSVKSVEVLWESFGTSVTPSKGDLVQGVKCEDRKIYFRTADTYHKGNAVIAAKDASGTILWSWHIWLTDQPQGQVYNNNAGTMMDRNLGATSATPGDVGALGLLYQWGRKDPFLGSSSISYNIEAKSTIIWPSAVSSDSSTGTLSYSVQHPTTFITRNGSNSDWYYTGSKSTDDTRWQSDKTIYDPCPAGWRVPDGGDNGAWSTAKGSSAYYDRPYDTINEGMNVSRDFGSYSTIWYPASGSRNCGDGRLNNVSYYGNYWSVTPRRFNAYYLYFYGNGRVYSTSYYTRATGFSVRCIQVID